MANEQTPITTTEDDGTEFEITTLPGDDSPLAGEIVEALFDDGTTPTDVTYADIDGDGKLDAGAADTDGDGQLDTVAGDTDGDGKVDAVAVDTDGDGNLDVIVMDTDGDGLVDAAGEDTDGDGQIDVVMLDTDGDGEFDVTQTDPDGDGEFEVEAAEGLPTDEELSTNSVEFTVGEDGFPVSDADPVYTAESGEDLSGDYAGGTTYDQVSDPVYTASASDPVPESVEDPTIAQQQAHADAAGDAQTRADEFVAQGDYAAAAEAREVAENEAYAAGDSSMLGASDSGDMENAAYKQELADDYRSQQADHIAAGDYESAKEDALNVGYQTGDADYLAGGSDHTGQADQDVSNLDNAVYDEKNADYFADNANWYAEQGNADAAQSSLEHAAEHQDSADTYAAAADPVSPMYDVDPSSGVDVGGGYEMSSVDTGFDAGVDMSPPVSYDSGTDDGTLKMNSKLIFAGPTLSGRFFI